MVGTQEVVMGQAEAAAAEQVAAEMAVGEVQEVVAAQAVAVALVLAQAPTAGAAPVVQEVALGQALEAPTAARTVARVQSVAPSQAAGGVGQAGMEWRESPPCLSRCALRPEAARVCSCTALIAQLA